jgi:hypothetical protein
MKQPIMSGNHMKRQREPYMQSMQGERTVNQMCAVLNYRPLKFPFLTVEKMCAVLNDLKCVVINGKYAVLMTTAAYV